MVVKRACDLFMVDELTVSIFTLQYLLKRFIIGR